MVVIYVTHSSHATQLMEQVEVFHDPDFTLDLADALSGEKCRTQFSSVPVSAALIRLFESSVTHIVGWKEIHVDVSSAGSVILCVLYVKIPYKRNIQSR